MSKPTDSKAGQLTALAARDVQKKHKEGLKDSSQRRNIKAWMFNSGCTKDLDSPKNKIRGTCLLKRG
jgi:hypothetical protein